MSKQTVNFNFITKSVAQILAVIKATHHNAHIQRSLEVFQSIYIRLCIISSNTIQLGKPPPLPIERKIKGLRPHDVVKVSVWRTKLTVFRSVCEHKWNGQRKTNAAPATSPSGVGNPVVEVFLTEKIVALVLVLWAKPKNQRLWVFYLKIKKKKADTSVRSTKVMFTVFCSMVINNLTCGRPTNSYICFFLRVRKERKTS